MQKPSIEQIIDFAFICLANCEIQSGFEEILATINSQNEQSSGSYRRAEILLYMKYIAFYFKDSNEEIPKYLIDEAREPISLELINAIKLRMKNRDATLNAHHGNLVDATTQISKDVTSDVNNVNKNETVESTKSVNPRIPKILFSKIEDTNFSVRLVNVLKKQGINYVGEILTIDFLHLYRLPNVGRGTHKELLTFLKENRIDDLKVKGWPDSNRIEEFAPKNIQLVRVSDQEKSDKVRLNVSDLTDNQLELALCETRFFPFSVRLKNALDALGIKYFGEILIDGNQEHFATMQNVGKRTKLELKKYLSDYEISSLLFANWPDEIAIKQIITERSLSIGKEFAIIEGREKTIEASAAAVLKIVSAPIHYDAMLKRFGLRDECVPWTLQEIGDVGFESGVPITRERVRQIEQKYIRKLQNNILSSQACDEIEAFTHNKIILSQGMVEAYIQKKELSNATNIFSLLLRLKDMCLVTLDYEVVEVAWLDTKFLVPAKFSKLLSDTVMMIRSELSGKVFLQINDLFIKLRPQNNSISDEDFDLFKVHFYKAMSHVKNIFLWQDERVAVIAKRAYRLASHGTNRDGRRTNSLISALSMIFSICKTVNLDVLYQAIQRDRRINEEISFALFRAYLLNCNFLDISENTVVCKNRPVYDGVKPRDYEIIKIAQEENSNILTSTVIQNKLVQCGMSSNSAGVLRTTTPLLVNIKKGNFRTAGIFRLVCDLDDIDLIDDAGTAQKNADFDTTSSEIKIRNTPPVRTTGRANVIDHTLSEGTFPVFDQNDNLLSEITIRGKLFIGLKSLAAKNPDKDICLIFKNEHFIFKA